MKKKLLSVAMLATTMFTTSAAAVDCDGSLYTLNAGRGNVGILVNLDEGSARTSTNYFSQAGDIATINSRALFSASAMAYDPTTDRIYYASTPTPSEYHLAGTDNGDYSDDELASLKLHPKAYFPHRLAYFDVSTQTHHLVGTTRFQINRMTFDPDTGVLYGSDSARFFTVDPNSAELTILGPMAPNIRYSGYSSWGDFVFYDSELLLVTNTRAFAIDKNTGTATVKFFHRIDFVTAATLDKNGEILISARNANVTGSPNSTHLWLLNPETDERNYGSQSHVGLVPMTVDAMTMVTSEQGACYSPRFAID